MNTRLMTNKHVLNALEHIADHGTTFVAATTFVMAAGVRPLVVAHTPKVDKENKQYSAANSIASGLIKFGLTEAVALPVENAVKNIDKASENFLKEETINSLKGSAKNLTSSKNYNIMTQIIKLSAGLITAIPKSMLTIALIPVIMDLLFNNKKQENNDSNRYDNFIKKPVPSVYDDFTNKGENVSFKGGITSAAEKGISKIIDNKTFQNILMKHDFNGTNVARNISMTTDVLLTASFVRQTSKSDKIKEERKKPLIYNNIISTAVSLAAGYSLDKAIQKGTKGFVDEFSRANKGNPKLDKYIQGINIVRPTLVFGAIYYGVLPLFTTFIADKTDKLINGKQNPNSQK